MRRIYLVRHGQPDTGTTEKVCLGQKDIPLNQKGKEEIQRLSEYFCRQEIANTLTGICCSPLNRCKETAEILCKALNQTYWHSKNASPTLKISSIEDLQEVNTGTWDGLTFKEIKERFPKEYEERGKNLGRYRIPSGETLEEAGLRFLHAIEKCLATTQGDLLVVTHAGVIRSFLCLITGKDINTLTEWAIPYGSITEISWYKTDRKEMIWHVISAGFLPIETMTLAKVEEIWKQSNATEDQKNHMRCVAAYALDLAEQLSGFSQRDKKILYYSALLHDMFRSMGRGHEDTGADWLLKKGYYELAEPVRMHNNPKVIHRGREKNITGHSEKVFNIADNPENAITIAELLYYADKRCRGTEFVSIQERFDSSRKKIRDEEGMCMHRKRMEAAFAIEEKLETQAAHSDDCGRINREM